VEGFREDNGWAIGDGKQEADAEAQDDADADSLYQLPEEEVVPSFYDREEGGLPRRWVATMKSSIESVVPSFSAHRMVKEYVDRIYLPAASRR